MRWLFGVLLLLPLVAWRASAQTTITAGGWTGGTQYTQSGKFDYCYISSNVRNGRSLTFAVSGERMWVLFFGDTRWQLKKDDNFDAILSIDDKPLTQGKVLVVTSDRVGTGLPNETVVFEKLRAGRAITLTVPWGTFKYSLNGSTKALNAVDACRARNAGASSAIIPSVAIASFRRES
jgi:hypothetical protein